MNGKYHETGHEYYDIKYFDLRVRYKIKQSTFNTDKITQLTGIGYILALSANCRHNEPYNGWLYIIRRTTVTMNT